MTDNRERGASAVEYGLLLAGIAAIIVAAVLVFGGAVQSLFTGSCDELVSGTGTTTVTCP